MQKRIWLDCGGKIDYETEKKLGDRLGWRETSEWKDYNDLTFSLNAPQGHLPGFPVCGGRVRVSGKNFGYVDRRALGFYCYSDVERWVREYGFDGLVWMERVSSLTSRAVICSL